MKKKLITGGICIVLDPGMDRSILMTKLKQSLDGGAGLIQIWNNWPAPGLRKDKEELIQQVVQVAGSYQATVLINEEWELLKSTPLDGIHFDSIPPDYSRIKEETGRNFIAGVTCGNNLEIVRRAELCGFDYVSFCAMFPSRSVENCDIVDPETVRKAGEMTQLPIFVSGGITPQNLAKLQDLDIDGVAVISGIMQSASPEQTVRNYNQVLKRMRKN